MTLLAGVCLKPCDMSFITITGRMSNHTNVVVVYRTNNTPMLYVSLEIAILMDWTPTQLL